MTSLLKYTKLAVPALLASTIAAAATTVDFTDGSTSGSLGSNGYALAAVGGSLVATSAVDAEALDDLNAVGLAGTFDGVGVLGTNDQGPDEVNDLEALVLSFDRKVRITNVYFLDLFADRGGSTDPEHAAVTDGANELIVGAQNNFRRNGGFADASLGAPFKLVGSEFTFFEFTGNDNVGVGDFALAGVTVAPIPLPAGFLLLGTALGGLGLARRRKKA